MNRRDEDIIEQTCTHGSSPVSCTDCLNEYIAREERLSLVDTKEQG